MKYLYLLIFSVVLNACQGKRNADSTGKVIAISDGDTFTILTDDQEQVKVRLHGIDAPEKKQPFGTAARQHLSRLIFNRRISHQVMDIDRYKRTVAIVYTEEGHNINEIMLADGYAWHYKAYDENPEWSLLENKARRAKAGLWQDPNAVPPWEWRKKIRDRSTISLQNSND